jgi:hypothetical protein
MVLLYLIMIFHPGKMATSIPASHVRTLLSSPHIFEYSNTQVAERLGLSHYRTPAEVLHMNPANSNSSNMERKFRPISNMIS